MSRPARGFPWLSHLTLAEVDRLAALNAKAKRIGLTTSEKTQITDLRWRSYKPRRTDGPIASEFRIARIGV